MSVRRVATASRGAKAGMFGRCAGVVGAVTFLVAACAGGSGGPDTAPAADRAGPSPTAPAATPGIDGGSYDVVDPAAEARGWFDVSQPERTEFRDLSAEFVARDDTEVTREYRAFVTRLGASAVAVRSALRRAGAPPQQAEALVA